MQNASIIILCVRDVRRKQLQPLLYAVSTNAIPTHKRYKLTNVILISVNCNVIVVCQKPRSGVDIIIIYIAGVIE